MRPHWTYIILHHTGAVFPLPVTFGVAGFKRVTSGGKGYFPNLTNFFS
jgi:hypothetical protein